MLINVKLSSPSFPALNVLMRIRLPSRLQATFWLPTITGRGAKGVHSVDKRHLRLTCKVRFYIEQQIKGVELAWKLSTCFSDQLEQETLTTSAVVVEGSLMGNSQRV